MANDAGRLVDGVRVLIPSVVYLSRESRDDGGTIREHDGVRVDLARAADLRTTDVPRLHRCRPLLRALPPAVDLLRLHLLQDRQASERRSAGAVYVGQGKTAARYARRILATC